MHLASFSSMPNYQKQIDDIIRNQEPFIQHNLWMQKTETKTNRVLISLKSTFFLLAFQNDVNSKPKPINISISNTIHFNLAPAIGQVTHHNPNTINIHLHINQDNVASEDENDDSESDNNGNNDPEDRSIKHHLHHPRLKVNMKKGSVSHKSWRSRRVSSPSDLN
jgi:beta-mannanase